MTTQQYDSTANWFYYANRTGWSPEEGEPEHRASFHKEWNRHCSYKQPRHMRSHHVQLAILGRMNSRTEAGCRRRGIDYPPF